MSTDNVLFGGVHVALADADVRLHTTHADGSVSIDLAGELAPLHVYLTGTADELHWLCDKLRAVVTAHESSTKLAGEAAARVAASATPAITEHWARTNGYEWGAPGSRDRELATEAFKLAMETVKS